MLRKAFMTEADLEDVARLETIHVRAAERERRLIQGAWPGEVRPPRQCSNSALPETGDAEAYPHCRNSH